jgi:MYXO-CTERM domain-containing protein
MSLDTGGSMPVSLERTSTPSPRARPRLFGVAAALAVLAFAAPGRAQSLLEVLEVKLDAPTLHALGVQVLIAGDDDRDATISVRVRKAGASEWRVGPPLHRVWPETIYVPVLQQFAGSVFDLEPGQSYEIELHAQDPDGLDTTQTISGATRPVPADPASPNAVAVTNVAELQSALAEAQPGDVITLADGTYAGAFFAISASGTEDNPIVIRGASQSGVVLDGQGCTGCNIVEIYGSWVHLERMTLRGADRAVRFQGQDTVGNVARRLIIEDVIHGIGGKTGQRSFLVSDNDIQGRLVWPWTFASDATSHWDDRGVDMTGDGHVVCHNRIVGFGDPIVNKQSMSRSWDVYGNDIQDSFDGTELDETEGNARLFHNRWTNVMAPISIQPVRGGPVYVMRNVLFNVPDEQIKLKSLGGVDEPSGALVYHNTFVSPKLALNLQTPIAQHNSVIANNLFVGPERLAGSRTVDWTAVLDATRFDFNGYFPDGGFWLGTSTSGENNIYDSFAAMQAAGVVEQNGLLLTQPIFEAAFVGPTDAMAHQEAPDFTLAADSNAIDRGTVLAGIDDGHLGSAPDLGALERGCPTPTYGPRPEGQEHLTYAIDCSTDTPTPTGSSGAGGAGAGASAGGDGAGASAAGGSGNGPGDGADAGAGSDGCGCRVQPIEEGRTWVGLLGLLLLSALRRKRSRQDGSALLR